MNPAVHLHVILDAERFVADITFKRSLPGMRPDVVVETVLLAKRLAAHVGVGAFEQLRLGMYLEMLP